MWELCASSKFKHMDLSGHNVVFSSETLVPAACTNDGTTTNRTKPETIVEIIWVLKFGWTFFIHFSSTFVLFAPSHATHQPTRRYMSANKNFYVSLRTFWTFSVSLWTHGTASGAKTKTDSDTKQKKKNKIKMTWVFFRGTTAFSRIFACTRISWYLMLFCALTKLNRLRSYQTLHACIRWPCWNWKVHGEHCGNWRWRKNVRFLSDAHSASSVPLNDGNETPAQHFVHWNWIESGGEGERNRER